MACPVDILYQPQLNMVRHFSDSMNETIYEMNHWTVDMKSSQATILAVMCAKNSGPWPRDAGVTL